jgi:putative acetyltransferase
MQLQIVKRRTKSIARFNDLEWKNADIEHYGSVQDFSEHTLRIVAREKGMIVGSLKLTVKRGVCEIQSVLVAKKVRGNGIGSALMREAETVARTYKARKLWLETGKGWHAESFYKRLGYKKRSALPHHYAGKDFVLYDKVID